MNIQLENEPSGITIPQAQNILPQFPGLLGNAEWSIPLTHDGKPVMVLMSWELFQSIEETLEIMGDQELMESLRNSIEDIAAGRLTSVEDVGA